MKQIFYLSDPSLPPSTTNPAIPLITKTISSFSPENILCNQIMPITGILRRVVIELDEFLGPDKSITFTIYKNGFATTSHVIFNDLQSIKTINCNVSFVPGDYLAIRATLNLYYSTANVVNTIVEIDTDGDNLSFYSTGASGLNTGTKRNPIFCNDSFTTNNAAVLSIAAIAGNFTGYYVYINNPNTAIDFTYNIVKNGVVQDGSGGTVNTTLNVANSVVGISTAHVAFTLPVVQGDSLYIQTVKTLGSVLSQHAAFSFESTVDQRSHFSLSPAQPVIDSFCPLGSSYGANWISTFNPRYRTINTSGFSLNDLYVKLSVAPGAGQSRTFTLYKNYVATNLTLTISDANTFGSFIGTEVTFHDDDIIGIYHTRSAAPAASEVYIALAQEPLTQVTPIASYSGIFFLDSESRHDTTIVDEAEVEVAIEAYGRSFFLRE